MRDDRTLKECGLTTASFAKAMREQGHSPEDIKYALKLYKKEGWDNWTVSQFKLESEVILWS
jgi:hypothetical protein